MPFCCQIEFIIQTPAPHASVATASRASRGDLRSPLILRIEQSARIPCSSDHPLDQYNKWPPHCCRLRTQQTDSTTVEGWMLKSNFVDPNEHPQENMHQYLWMRISRAIVSSSKEKRNNVADALSRDWHLGDDELTSLLRSHIPEQMPESFRISPLPKVIRVMILA